MRLRFTYKDLLLLLGIAVAILIAVSTLISKDGLFSDKPSFTKKVVSITKAAVYIQKQYCTLLK